MGIFALVKQTTTDTTTKTNEDTTTKTNEDTTTDPKVLLVGNLSSVYTDALNKVYAIEGVGYTGMQATIADTTEEESNTDLYVHILDESDIEEDLLSTSSKLSIALDKHRGSKRVVVLESEDVCRRDLLARHATKHGATVIVDRELAIEYISQYSRGTVK